MGNLTAWILGICGPMVMKVLAQLGMGVVAYAGVTAALDSMLNQARSSWSSMPVDVLSLMAISGVNTALGIIAGGMVARVSLMVFKRLQIK